MQPWEFSSRARPRGKADCQPCEICSQELSVVASVEDNLRALKFKQIHSHEKLISGKSFALHPGQKYYLVPSSLLSGWRAYVTATGENVSSLPEPQSLEAIVNSLKCEKTDGLAVISESDWRLFSEEWNVTQENGISAEIVFSKSSPDQLHESSEAMPILDEDLEQSVNDANDDLGVRGSEQIPSLCGLQI